MTVQFEPPPTYAEVVVTDPVTKVGHFNPIWLKWFLDLTSLLTTLNNNSGSGVMQVSIAVGGNTDVLLTSAQAAFNILELYGALTGNINVKVPAVAGQWTVHNATTGAFTLTFTAVSGTGLVLEQGYRGIFYFDGTNMVRANDSVVA